MNKKVYLFAAVAALFAACSNNDGAESAEKAQAQAQAQQIAVGFDAYLGRATTRAVTDKTALENSGFGVFAYYTDNDDYDGQQIPNFMWNQKVSTASWTYEPVKYWPNEYGENAIAEETDRISFFAYGPYADALTASGKVNGATKGIIGFTRNNYAGDPLVKYVVDVNPATSLDLVWGRTPKTSGFDDYEGNTYSNEGLPWLNVKRPKYNTNEKVKFQFDHALASLNVTVDHFADNASYAADKNVDGNTRIWIRSITFTGFTTQGALNLNNTATHDVTISSTSTKIGTANWLGINGEDLVTGEEVTIYDGRKDGKEGTASASNEKYTGLNPNLVQSGAYATAAAGGGTDDAGQSYAEGDLIMGDGKKPGVISVAQNLFDPTGVSGYTAQTAIKADEPIYVIPTGDVVTVTIAYDVETADNKLATKLSDNATNGSSISNVITKKIQVSSTDLVLENGKKYTIKLHLGMNSVKFDADVTAWDDGSTANADLPEN